MSIMDFLKKAIPSLRTYDYLISKSDELSTEIDALKKENQSYIKQLHQKNEYFFWLSQRREGESLSETKKRVFMDLPKAEGDIRCIQLGSNYILQRLKDICDKKDIHFSLSGGSLLGAIRHNGFIPWDDDVDIVIERSDYKRLEAAVNEDSELSIKYYYTPVGEKTIKVRHIDSEVFWVDVFPFDRIEVSPENESSLRKKIADSHYALSEEIRKKMLSDEACFITKKDQPVPQLDAFIDDAYKKYKTDIPFSDSGNYCLSGFDNYNNPLVILCDYYRCFPLKSNVVTFEGKQYDAFNDYIYFLEVLFGDYYTFPLMVSNHIRYNDSLRKEYDFLKKHNIIV